MKPTKKTGYKKIIYKKSDKLKHPEKVLDVLPSNSNNADTDKTLDTLVAYYTEKPVVITSPITTEDKDELFNRAKYNPDYINDRLSISSQQVQTIHTTGLGTSNITIDDSITLEDLYNHIDTFVANDLLKNKPLIDGNRLPTVYIHKSFNMVATQNPTDKSHLSQNSVYICYITINFIAFGKTQYIRHQLYRSSKLDSNFFKQCINFFDTTVEKIANIREIR